jgi:MbtH protein
MSEEYTDWQDSEVKLVKNQDGICSIWPADRQNAPGWEDVGISGTKAECLEYVTEHCDSNCRLKEPDKPGVTTHTEELALSEQVSE